jgi:hypothetical protein
MAFAILKGLRAPADVSSARIDARAGKLVEATGCQITDVKRGDKTVEFTRLDDGLPLNYGLFFSLNFRFVPIPEQLNRYRLAVSDLPEGQYDVVADGRGAGHFSAAQLAEGVNLASTTADAWQPGGPWNAQADLLRQLTDARYHLDLARMQAGHFLPGSDLAKDLGRRVGTTDQEIVAMQRDTAAPRPYRFVVRPYVAENKK